MEYINEHLLPGQIGHFCIILGFVSSILAAVSFFAATNAKEDILQQSWKRIGRLAFTVHGISIFIVIACVFYVMINSYYEYDYALQHVSDDLDFKYIFSAFWEGQEGSFMLWLFWHIVLGGVLMFTAKEWEAPVMSILSFIQVFLVSMILGLYFYFGDEFFKIGSNPLVLTRDVRDAPIFSNPNYTSLINGNGLNPLLQNYWMTIHPPTLFLGFASTCVPFMYAVAGLWTGKHKEWLKPVLPWALFSGAILGLGILMGGAWAYEALSFGGYWAWDPVENMSLVPWLILIAGIHANLIAKGAGYSIKSTYLFYIFTFVLILYSTFLTRSGILGDTSVHAFTEMGMEWQLVGFIMAFLIPPLGMFFYRMRSIPSPKREESVYSREFWMFIGALVLLFSSILISFTTSIPVYNTIFTALDMPESWQRRPPIDVVDHYNRYQLWIGVLLAVFSGAAQFLRFKEQDSLSNERIGKLVRNIGYTAILTSFVSFLIAWSGNINAWQYKLLLWSGVFSILINMNYILSVVKFNMKLAGSAMGHLGIGILMIGVLFSGANKDFVSRGFMDASMIEGFTEEDADKNILLPKGLPTKMSDYLVTYVGDEIDGFTRTFNINYKKLGDDGKVLEEFDLHPNVLYNKMMTKIEASNPDTKHYAHKDIFTHVVGLPISEVDKEVEKKQLDSLKYETHILKQGDTIWATKSYIVFEGFNQKPTNEKYVSKSGDIPVAANLVARKMDTEKIWKAEPIYLIRESFGLSIDDEIKELGLKFKFPKVNPQDRTVTIAMAETKPRQEYVVLQAILFPWINLVWIGCLLSLFGLFFSMIYRIRSKRKRIADS